MHFRHLLAGLGALMLLSVGGLAHAQPSGISQKVAVCDPKFPNNCLKPAADGSQPVTGAGGGGGAVTLAAGSVASGAYVSGSLAAGSMVDLIAVTGSKGPGTAAVNSLLTGGVYTSAGITLTNGQQAALQFDSTGHLMTTASVGGISQGSTTSGQTGVLNMAAVTTAAPSYTTAQTSPLSLDVHGALRFLPMTAAGVAVDLTSPSSLVGADGSTIMSASNPLNVINGAQTDTVMIGGVNVKEINAVAPLMGNGVTGTGSQRVTIASDNTAFSVNATLQAGSALVGKVGIDQTTNGTTNAVVEKPATSGGLTACTFEVAASDNHQNCKGTAGQVYAIQGFSIHTAAMFMRLYNAAAAFNGCNSATNLVWEGQIPASGTTGGGFALTFPTGLAFSSGIAVCVTGAYGNTNTTSATASVASVNIQYQ